MEEPQISFREEEYASSRPQKSVTNIGLVSRAVIALGLAEDKKQAQTVLLYIAVAAFVLAVVVFFGFMPKSKLGNPPPTAPTAQQ